MNPRRTPQTSSRAPLRTLLKPIGFSDIATASFIESVLGDINVALSFCMMGLLHEPLSDKPESISSDGWPKEGKSIAWLYSPYRFSWEVPWIAHFWKISATVCCVVVQRASWFRCLSISVLLTLGTCVLVVNLRCRYSILAVEDAFSKTANLISTYWSA